jgi:Ser-tRNA(Ala) deacylase AlaX
MVLHNIKEHTPIRAVEEDVKIMIDSQDRKQMIQEAIHVLAP